MSLQQHWENMLGVIRGVSTVEDLDQFGPVVLDELDKLIPADNSSFNEVDPLAQRARVVGRPRPVTAEEVAIWERWSHQNPALMHMLRTGDGSAKRISDFMTSEQLHSLELYTHVYEPLGVEYQLAVALPAPRPTVLGVALNRGDRDFSNEETELLDALRPHLVQAYRHAQLITNHRDALARVTGALEQQGRAFHVVGERLNGPAELLLSRHFDPVADALPLAVQAWVDNERASFASAEPGRLRQPLISVREGRRLTLLFVPGGNSPDLVWLVERASETDATPLRSLGLSNRQAEVLWLLTKGKPVAEIARDLEISTGTVKKHLEHVYRKLGVPTATAAISQAFDALAVSIDQ